MLAVNATVMEPTSEVAAQAEDIILYVVQIKNTQICMIIFIIKIIYPVEIYFSVVMR